MRRIALIFLLVLLLIVVGFFYFRYSWVFGEGAKSGELNYVVHKGWVWKTYEGKLIQTGLKGQGGSMQSNEFIFSVKDERIAKQLMVNSGKTFNLHYVEYQGALPWRGMSPYVVDSIISMSGSATPVPGALP
jgi:hypothetical protein